ncbi:MAG: cupredoxin domain-containing protein [Acidimicrobiales bacterium]
MRTRVLISALVVLAGTAACGSGESATPTTEAKTTTTAVKQLDLSDADWTDETASKEVKVEARDNIFVDQYVEVKAGTTVTFTNAGRNRHDVIPAEKGAFPEIAVTDFEPGDTGTITLDEPGDYVYYCSLHGTPSKGMVAAFRVVGE